MPIRRIQSQAETFADPVLEADELGLDPATKELRVGDGTTAWTGLPAAGSATYAPWDALGGGALISFIGDSVTGFNIANADAYHHHMCVLSGGRLSHYGAYGTTGYTLAQIEANHLPTVLALTPKPRYCVIGGGTNDVGDGAYNAATSRATLARIVGTLRAAGVIPVLVKIPPREDSAPVNVLARAWNSWIHLYAQTNGLPVLDMHSALVDEATGNYLAALKLDTVHPNITGHQAIGAAGAASAWVQAIQAVPLLTTSDHTGGPGLVDPTGRLVFLDGVDGGLRPTGWAEYSSGFHTGVIDTVNPNPGNWWSITRAAALAAGGGYQLDISSGFAVGDLIYVGLRYDVVSDPITTTSVRAQAFCQQRTSGGSANGTAYLLGPGGTFSGTGGRLFRVNSGTTVLRLEMSLSAFTTVADTTGKFGQWTIHNLTTLGIA